MLLRDFGVGIQVKIDLALFAFADRDGGVFLLDADTVRARNAIEVGVVAVFVRLLVSRGEGGGIVDEIDRDAFDGLSAAGDRARNGGGGHHFEFKLIAVARVDSLVERRYSRATDQ